MPPPLYNPQIAWAIPGTCGIRVYVLRTDTRCRKPGKPLQCRQSIHLDVLLNRYMLISLSSPRVMGAEAPGYWLAVGLPRPKQYSYKLVASFTKH